MTTDPTGGPDDRGDAAEAWFKEMQRGGWQIGDRVRIRLQGEYPLIQLSSGGQIHAHQPSEDGQTGTITERIEDDTGCVYRVVFDRPFPPMPSLPAVTIDAWLYTAAELEPLPADAGRPGRAHGA